MSDQQKIFASLSGAVVAHLLLLQFVIFLLSTSSVGSALSRSDTTDAGGPREVTVMLNDLLDDIEKVEKPKPEEPEAPALPEPLPEERRSKSFIDTDLNSPEAEAPENAAFESDRNTSAAAELMPDENLPQREGPTTVGDLPIERITLQKREYVDGRLNEPAAPPGTNASNQSPVAPAEGSEGGGFPANPSQAEASASRPPALETESEVGEAEESEEGADVPPEQTIGAERTRPEKSETDGDAEKTLVQKSFTLPGIDPSKALPHREDLEDVFSATKPEPEDPIGEMQDLAEKTEAAQGGVGDDPEAEVKENLAEDSPPEAEQPADKPGMRPADKGLFADGFSAERMQSTTSGTLTSLGQNAMDAEETEVGKYKKQVRQVISKKWHQYRVENGEHVTWGILKLTCRVDRFGKVNDLKIIENKANTMLADFSLKAILDADLPPMPADVAEELGEPGLELNYDIIIY